MSNAALLSVTLLFFGGIGYQAIPQPQEDQNEKSMMRCSVMQAMKSIELHANSPDILVAQAKPLDLSEEQQQQLNKISKSAQP